MLPKNLSGDLKCIFSFLTFPPQPTEIQLRTSQASPPTVLLRTNHLVTELSVEIPLLPLWLCFVFDLFFHSHTIPWMRTSRASPDGTEEVEERRKRRGDIELLWLLLLQQYFAIISFYFQTGLELIIALQISNRDLRRVQCSGWSNYPIATGLQHPELKGWSTLQGSSSPRQ